MLDEARYLLVRHQMGEPVWRRRGGEFPFLLSAPGFHNVERRRAQENEAIDQFARVIQSTQPPEMTTRDYYEMARAFIADHGGALRRFTDFTAADVLAPTGPATADDGADEGVADRLKALTRPKGD